jgi:hypothetical protein
VENPAVFAKDLELRPVHFPLPSRLESWIGPRLAILAEMQHFVVGFLGPDNAAVLGMKPKNVLRFDEK